MKTIGIIGGISPSSTKLYYERLVTSGFDRYHKYLPIVIYSVDFDRCWDLLSSNNIRALNQEFLRVIRKLKKAGARYAAISAVSMHAVMPLLQRKSPIPIIDGWECAAQRMQQDNVRRVLLLGTRYIMENKQFKRHLNDHHIAVIIPSSPERKRIEHIIKDQLNKGIIRATSKRSIQSIVTTYSKETDGVYLACTALPTILSQSDIPNVKIYDFVNLHIDAMLSRIA